MEKAGIVEILEEIGELLELKGENPFKVRAYQSGARALEILEEDLSVVIEEERLGKIKGIGKALVEKVTTLHETGELEYYDKLKASIPDGLLEMMDIPGLGPKKIKKVYDALSVDSIEKLAEACKSGAVAELSGFGKKTADKILSGIANREAYGKRHRWQSAFEVAAPILEGLRDLKEVEVAEAAGSLRRKRETVGDLDFIVGSSNPGPIMDWFTGLEGVVEVTAKGETKSSVRFETGLQADLRIVPGEQFSFALHHFTGSKDHNVKMRQRALDRGLSLSEWGFKTPSGDSFAKESETVKSESDLFRILDLEFIEPELREGMGEIEAAEAKKLPDLIDVSSIKGVFHNHTHASDGRNSLEEMTEAAEALGFEYWGVADHSKASFQANGLDEERLLKQVDEVAALNESGRFKCHVFSGSEVDILKDGSLDFEDSVLEKLDYVVASVHASFTLTEEEQTARIIKAIENENVTMLGHLTGRLILKREPYRVNIPKVIDAAIANRTIIELNASPWRLDMDWVHWRRAAEKGLVCSINPDAHSIEGFECFRNGVYAARKGWLTEEHVLNAWDIEKVRTWLAG